MRLKFNKPIIVGAILLQGLCVSAQTKSTSADPRPFDIEFGATKCESLSTKWGAPMQENTSGATVVFAPKDLYPGATRIVAVCPEGAAGTVGALTMRATKGGMGSPEAISTYKKLAAKYKLVEGGPIRALGDGFARFQAGKMVIVMSSPHLAFEYDVNYVTQGAWDVAIAEELAKRKSAQAKQDKL